ncbi:MAG TPA: response regulator transcription factor [Symbiobacteriaceae bacterium]|nr:response regulator transcription factor [Symbiobacteriaceae bacterium]
MPIVAPETARCILGRLQLNAGGEPRCPGARKSTDGALTPRETEIVSLIADGATNREIGSTLMLSQNTVKNHIKHILDKLHLQNRTQVAAWATRSGFASQR